MLFFMIPVLTFMAGCENPPQFSSFQKNKKALKSQQERLAQESQKASSLKENQNIEPVPAKSSFQPFYVFSEKGSRQNHFIPSGFMPNGKCLQFDDVWRDNCHKGNTCIKIVYDIECSRQDKRWAGIYWLNPPNNWGQRKGGFDLTGAQRLTFWARGDRGGEQIQEITVGGISGDYPDSDISVIGPVILTPQWRQYSIDLRGKDLSYISGGFAWSTSEEVNPETCTFYLDEIRYE